MTDQPDRPGRKGQLPLQFPRAQLTFDDLLTSDANRTTLSTLRRWRDWRRSVHALSGPAKSGISTMVTAWAADAGAEQFEPRNFSRLGNKSIESLARGAVAIDDADMVKAEDNLLFLINLSDRLGGHVLLGSHLAPSTWRMKAPDLVSRLRALPLMRIDEPDEEMFRARLKAAFKREFLVLPRPVEDYVAIRMGRSYAALEDFVTRLSEGSAGREITVPLAREVLDAGEDTLNLFDDGAQP